MEQRGSWGEATAAPKEKIQYIPLQRENEKMEEANKEGVRIWNLMVKTLRDNGLMEEK